MLTVGQLKEILCNGNREPKASTEEETPKNYVYGLNGIATIFNCSRVTANKIKQSGKIDAAIKQIGRKIVVDADLAFTLMNKHEHKPKTLFRSPIWIYLRYNISNELQITY